MRLNPDKRQLIVDRINAGKSNAEIAQELGIKTHSVVMVRRYMEKETEQPKPDTEKTKSVPKVKNSSILELVDTCARHMQLDMSTVSITGKLPDSNTTFTITISRRDT